MSIFKLDGIFGDKMVLQRDTENCLWGLSNGDVDIVAIFENSEYKATIDGDRFIIKLPRHEAGTGFTIEIRSQGGYVKLEDVCFGDVFVLAGQSNMELPVSRTLDISKKEIDKANYPYIRQYRVTPQYRLAPDKLAALPDLPWTTAEPEQIMEMSALGFYTSQIVQSSINVPIGLILLAQGGANVETYMNEKDLKKYGNFDETIAKFQEDNSVQEYLEKAGQSNAEWRREFETGKDAVLSAVVPKGSTTINQPGMIKDVQGCFWLYKKVFFDKIEGEDAFIYLSNIIDVDRTYINGVFVGNTEYRYPPRKYSFPASVLREGENLIAIRLLAEGNMGGVVPEHSFYIENGTQRINLEGEWELFRETKAQRNLTPSMMGQTIPTALYYSQLVPLKDLKFKGMWWYQGETNAEHPAHYDEEFKDMINSWRRLVGFEFPVVLVQMPDYIDPINGPDSNWDLIQEYQLKAPEMISKCMTAVGKDLGERQELHPQRKAELGARFAECVMKLMYNN